jgi:hypothetical protein
MSCRDRKKFPSARRRERVHRRQSEGPVFLTPPLMESKLVTDLGDDVEFRGVCAVGGDDAFRDDFPDGVGAEVHDVHVGFVRVVRRCLVRGCAVWC